MTQAILPLLLKSMAARMVNLSSCLGSLAMNGDPASPNSFAQLIGYGASKAALHMLTVQLSQEFRNTSRVVNSISRGYAKTDLTGCIGFLIPAAKTPVNYALLGDNAVSGRFVNSESVIAW